MDGWLKEAFEAIDAGFFTGDALHDEGILQEAEEYIERWKGCIDDIRRYAE